MVFCAFMLSVFLGMDWGRHYLLREFWYEFSAQFLVGMQLIGGLLIAAYLADKVQKARDGRVWLSFAVLILVWAAIWLAAEFLIDGSRQVQYRAEQLRDTDYDYSGSRR